MTSPDPTRLTAAELAEAKNELVTAKLRERETIDGRGFALGYALNVLGDAAKANTELADLQAVTAADVQRVARTILNPAKRVELRYAKGDGDAKGWANPTPLPRFSSPPPAAQPPLALLPEGQRQGGDRTTPCGPASRMPLTWMLLGGGAPAVTALGEPKRTAADARFGGAALSPTDALGAMAGRGARICSTQ